MQISMDEVSNNSFDNNRMPYFKLAENEIAYVRFMPGVPEIFNAHHVEFQSSTGKKIFSSIDCLRTVGGTIDDCPFCASSDPELTKIYQEGYIKLIQYKRDTTGKLVSAPCIWSKSASWIKKNFMNYVTTYGPSLINVLFQVQRQGSGLETTYQLTPLLGIPNFSENEYPIPKVDPFNGYEVRGTNLTVKTADDMKYFIQTKNFPYNVVPAGVPNLGNAVIDNEELPFPSAAQSVDDNLKPLEFPMGNAPAVPASQPAPQPAPAPVVQQTTPWATAQPQMDRPVRRYN